MRPKTIVVVFPFWSIKPIIEFGLSIEKLEVFSFSSGKIFLTFIEDNASKSFLIYKELAEIF